MKILITEKQKTIIEQLSSVRILSPKQKDYCFRYLADILGDADFFELEENVKHFKETPNKESASIIVDYINALPQYLFIHIATNKITSNNEGDKTPKNGWNKIAIVELLGLDESMVIELSKYTK